MMARVWTAVLLAALVAVSYAQCTIVIDEETGDEYDLNPLQNDVADYVIPEGAYESDIVLNVCRPFLGTLHPSCMSKGGGICEHGVMFLSLGDTATTPVILSEGRLKLVYASACSTQDPCTILELVCDEEAGVGSPTFVSEVAYSTFNLRWETAYACPVKKSGGLSGGDVFLILFFVGGFVYLAAGYAYNYKQRELRGSEAVPNIAFWRDLPGLVKDGCLFTKTKIFG